jgi:DNA primase
MGFTRVSSFYNLHRLGDQAETVIVVEGFFDAIWLTQCGFPNVIA